MRKQVNGRWRRAEAAGGAPAGIKGKGLQAQRWNWMGRYRVGWMQCDAIRAVGGRAARRGALEIQCVASIHSENLWLARQRAGLGQKTREDNREGENLARAT